MPWNGVAIGFSVSVAIVVFGYFSGWARGELGPIKTLRHGGEARMGAVGVLTAGADRGFFSAWLFANRKRISDDFDPRLSMRASP